MGRLGQRFVSSGHSESRGTGRQGSTNERLQLVLVGITFLSAIATASAGPNGVFWIKLLVGVAGLGAILLAIPSLVRRWRAWRNEIQSSRKLRLAWQEFALEVKERARFFEHSDTRGLHGLLIALRADPQDEAARQRMFHLSESGQAVVALNGGMLALWHLMSVGWLGAEAAKAAVNIFEVIFDFPVASGLVRNLRQHAGEMKDAQQVDEWIRYYMTSRMDYGKFAKRQNHSMGVKIFGEHFAN